MQKLWLSPVRGPLASVMLVVYCAVVLVIPAVVFAQIEESTAVECMQGKTDGERDGKGNAAWILGGIGCGIIGVGAAYFSKPNPDASVLLGKSPEYVLCYTEAYQSKAKGKNAGYAAIGWAISLVILLATGAFETE
ncbi:hypothetical protein KAW64_02825 [bacterium]|nr:hypothetical protein [bacterium]